MPRTLLITGVTGHLGAELARAAGAAGWAVAGTRLSSPPPERPAIAARRLDVRDAAAVSRVVAEVRPDAVVHTAYRQDDDAWAINAEGSRNVAVAATGAGARLVHISTDVVFSGRLGRPYREDDPLDPVTDYGRSKEAAEAAVIDEAPEALIVRTSLLYGGPGASRQEQLVIDAARGLREFRFFADELRCPVAVPDLAAAVLELVETDAAGPLHVVPEEGLSRYEFARLVARSRGLPADAVQRAALTALEAGRPADCRLDPGRAAELLQTRMRGATEVLAG